MEFRPSLPDRPTRAVPLLWVLFLFACGPALADAQKENPYTGDTEAQEHGKKLYKRLNCYACHGQAGGGGMGPSLMDANWKNGNGSDPDLFAQISGGRGAMPPYKGIASEEDIWKVIAFVRTLYKGDPENISW